jgi:hypothetical protein
MATVMLSSARGVPGCRVMRSPRLAIWSASKLKLGMFGGKGEAIESNATTSAAFTVMVTWEGALSTLPSLTTRLKT